MSTARQGPLRRLLAVVLLAVVTTACSFFGSEPESPELRPIDLRGSVAGLVDVDGTVWASVHRDAGGTPDDPGWTELVALDAATGTVVARERIADGPAGDVFHIDNTFFVRRSGKLPAVPVVSTVPDQLFGPFDNDERQYVLEVDGSTFEVVTQIEVPVHPLDGDQLVEIDDRLWVLGLFGTWVVDPDTGDARQISLVGGFVHSAQLTADDLWVVTDRSALQIDRTTTEVVKTHFYEDSAAGSDLLSGRFKRHDDRFWVSGAPFDDFDHVYQYDLETSETSNPVPQEDFPTRAFESGGYRWELFNSEWLQRPDASPQSGDVWKQFDTETGEELAAYEFGDFTPRLVAGGQLWLTRQSGDRIELTRLPIDR